MEVNYHDLVEKLRWERPEVLPGGTLRISDIVTVHVDGREENRGLVGRGNRGDEGRGVFLNLSRGFVVDVEALARNVRGGRSAAAVDVFPESQDQQGPFSSPLQGLRT